MAMNKTISQSLTPKVVLGVAAHPDDLDYYGGGTMAAFAKQGAEVYYLVLTDGSKGSADRTMTAEHLRDLRRDEQRKAGAILGVKDIFFCDFVDGELENTLEVKREVVRAIRRVKPDVLVALDPTVYYSAPHSFVNHPDHRAAGQAALDAVYPLARDHMSFPELLADGYEPHNTATLLLIGMQVVEPTFAVDISDTLEQKYQALAAHASQFSIQEMKEDIDRVATQAGASYGYTYAESFVRIDIA
jgi:LmbE family N-acetylglucosaminyl deacetylase